MLSPPQLLPSVIVQGKKKKEANSTHYSNRCNFTHTDSETKHTHMLILTSNQQQFKEVQIWWKKTTKKQRSYNNYLMWPQDRCYPWRKPHELLQHVLDGGSIFVSCWPLRIGFLQSGPINFPTSCLKAFFFSYQVIKNYCLHPFLI